ncbi:MAG: voltage-gated chloride channel family protein [Chitinophagaceae bacterium]|nr:voltage-gated chloride channel family protein [Chitinophagaceae bacterium]
MQSIKLKLEQLSIANYLVKWAFLVTPLAIAVGSLVALFLWLLDYVTVLRWQNNWLLFLLPFAGIAIYFLYLFWGKKTDAGNNLIIDEIHEPDGGVPARIAPLVLFSTLVTHLFGGSAGREGTAVQMGGGMAGLFGRLLKLNPHDLRVLLMAGIAAGFAAVFGTPVTGTVFAMEVIAIGSIKYDALIPCMIASLIADTVCSSWGIHHTIYTIHFTKNTGVGYFEMNAILIAKVALAGIAFGLVAFLFGEMQHSIKSYSNQLIKHKWLIPALGGTIVIGLSYLLNTTDYLGLGVNAQNTSGISIVNAFNEGGVNTWSWFWKLLFTVITLGTGFKGGEVTPLFFIGATLGNTIAWISGAPIDLFAALGFIAVFAGATNTPLACTIMGVELFGGEHIVYYAVACFIAYYFSGHSGIYSSQRIGVSKIRSEAILAHTTLKQLRDKRKNKISKHHNN